MPNIKQHLLILDDTVDNVSESSKRNSLNLLRIDGISLGFVRGESVVDISCVKFNCSFVD